jgi:hypothetical protein
MAPEIAEDSRIVDTRADLYSLGCTLYYLLTGHTPFPGGSWTEKIIRHRLDAITPPQKYRSDLPAEVVAILYRLLAKDPAQRFQVPADLATALQAWLAVEETEPWPQAFLPSTAVVQTPDLTHEGTWPSLEMESPCLSAPADPVVPQIATPHAEPAFIRSAGVIAFKIAVCVAALSFSALFGLALAWGVKHWEERPPVASGAPVAAIAGPTAPSESEKANVPAPVFEVHGKRFSTLSAAVESAQDGDTVIIPGNGAIATEPLVLRDKTLTLQAAPGCRPGLRLTPQRGPHPWQALVTSDRALTLVGLDLACSSAEGRKAPREPMHLIYMQQAALQLIDCRLAAPGVTAPIVCRNCPKVEMRGCKLAAAASTLCVEIGDGGGCELVLDNCQFATEQPDGAAVSLWAADGKSSSSPHVTIAHSTFNVGRVLACTGLSTGPEISAQSNNLAFEQALVSCSAMIASPNGPRFHWQGNANTFQGAGEWVLVDGKPGGVHGLDAWRAHCGSDEPGSIEK